MGPPMDASILLFTALLLVGGVMAYAMVTLPRLIAPKEGSVAKARPYECGEIPVGPPWIRFRVAYYIFALIFVVFDIEAVFLYPWAVIFHKLGVFGLVEMIVFIFILALGLAYAWRKGVLQWV